MILTRDQCNYGAHLAASAPSSASTHMMSPMSCRSSVTGSRRQPPRATHLPLCSVNIDAFPRSFVHAESHAHTIELHRALQQESWRQRGGADEHPPLADALECTRHAPLTSSSCGSGTARKVINTHAACAIITNQACGGTQQTALPSSSEPSSGAPLLLPFFDFLPGAGACSMSLPPRGILIHRMQSQTKHLLHMCASFFLMRAAALAAADLLERSDDASSDARVQQPRPPTAVFVGGGGVNQNAVLMSSSTLAQQKKYTEFCCLFAAYMLKVLLLFTRPTSPTPPCISAGSMPLPVT